MHPRLQTIQQRIRARKFSAARQDLEDYLESTPDDPQAWYLRSFVEESAEGKRAAINRAVELAPKNKVILKRAAQLAQKPAKSSGSTSAVWGWLLLTALALLIAAAAVTFVLTRKQPEVAVQPTSVIVPSATITFTPTPTDTPTSTPTSTATEPPSQTPEPSATFTETPSPVPSETQTPTREMVSVQATTFISQPAALPTAEPTEEIVVIDPGLPDDPSLPTDPEVTPDSDNVPPDNSPIDQVINIGIGDMRVIETTDPADDQMANFGAAAPALPDGQKYVVLEAMLMCENSANCGIPTQNMQLVSADGQRFDINAEVDILPLFGSDSANGQSWGYLAFAVPENSGRLTLVVNQGGNEYLFRLQRT